MRAGELPCRRRNSTMPLSWSSLDGVPHVFEVTVGYYDSGESGEVFATGPREGSTLQGILSDACILISKLRQAGTSFVAIADYLDVADPAAPSVSPLGAIVQQCAAIERGEPVPFIQETTQRPISVDLKVVILSAAGRGVLWLAGRLTGLGMALVYAAQRRAGAR